MIDKTITLKGLGKGGRVKNMMTETANNKMSVGDVVRNVGCVQ